MSSAIEAVPAKSEKTPSALVALAAADRRDLSSGDREELSQPAFDTDLPAGVVAALSAC